jgi:hypothetical protein
MITVKKKMNIGFILASLFISVSAFAKAPSTAYQTTGVCDGLPKIGVDTPVGFCVGLVADGFKFTRGIAPLANGDLVVVDMGGWAENKGSVWLLKKVTGADKSVKYERTRLLNNIDRPNGVAVGPDNKIYVGAINRIFRFDVTKPTDTEDVIGGKSGTAPLPTVGLHPLKQMVFDHDNKPMCAPKIAAYKIPANLVQKPWVTTREAPCVNTPCNGQPAR